MVTSVSSCLFGFVTGSAAADVAAIGSIMMPEMVKRGYSKPFAATLQSCTGVLGGIIPPSILLVIVGVTGGISVGDLLLGAVIPGWLVGFSLMGLSYFIYKKRNYQGTGSGQDGRKL